MITRWRIWRNWRNWRRQLRWWRNDHGGLPGRGGHPRADSTRHDKRDDHGDKRT